MIYINLAIACVLVEVVFDKQFPEFGALVVDSNGIRRLSWLARME